jgi:hypothetical protein
MRMNDAPSKKTADECEFEIIAQEAAIVLAEPSRWA